jgi:hypothetical protein
LFFFRGFRFYLFFSKFIVLRGLRFYFPFLFWLAVAASGLAGCPDRRERSTRDSSMRTRLWTRWWSPGPRIGNGCSKMLSADS